LYHHKPTRLGSPVKKAGQIWAFECRKCGKPGSNDGLRDTQDCPKPDAPADKPEEKRA